LRFFKQNAHLLSYSVYNSERSILFNKNKFNNFPKNIPFYKSLISVGIYSISDSNNAANWKKTEKKFSNYSYSI